MPPSSRFKFVVNVYSLRKYGTLTMPNRDALTLSNPDLTWHAFDGLGCRANMWSRRPSLRLVN
jgi:hypothetical protein